MSTRRDGSCRCVAILLWSLAVSVSAFSHAQLLEEQGIAALPFDRLRLSVHCPSKVHVVGVPIAVYACLSNTHQKPIHAHAGFGWFRRGGTAALSFGYLTLDLLRDGKVQQYTPPGMWQINIPPPDPLLIGPGRVLRAKALLVPCGATSRALLTAGTLDISAAFARATPPKSVVRSEILVITLVPPKDDDAMAFTWLENRHLLHYCGYIRFMQNSLKQEDVESLAVFIRKYPRSPYAAYAAFGLGQMHFYRKHYADAVGVLRSLANEHPDTAVAEDALYLAAESYRAIGNVADAEKCLHQLIRRYPDTVAAEDAQAILGETPTQEGDITDSPGADKR